MKLVIISLFLMATPAFAGDVFYGDPAVTRYEYAYGEMLRRSERLDESIREREEFFKKENKSLNHYSDEGREWRKELLDRQRALCDKGEKKEMEALAVTVEEHHFNQPDMR